MSSVPRRPALALVCWLLLACACAVQAAVPDWERLERNASDDPRATIVQVEGLRREFHSQGDASSELEALLILASAQAALERQAELRATAEAAVALSRRLGHAAAEARALAAKAEAMDLAGEYDRAERALAEAEAVLVRTEDARARAEVAMQSGRTHESRLRLGPAMEQYTRAHALYERLGRKDGMSAALSAMADVHDRLGNHLQAIETNRKVLALDSASGLRLNQAVTTFNIGVSYRDLGRYDEAERHLREARRLSVSLKDEAGVAYVDYQLGVIAVERGRAAEALPHFARALPHFIEGGNAVMHFQTLLGQARAHALLGELRALELLEQAGRMAAELKAPERSQAYHQRAAEVLASLDRFQEAFGHMHSLRRVEQDIQAGSRAKLAEELQARFQLKEKEQENALLRTRQELQGAQLERQGSQRLSLALALALALLLLGGSGAVLWREMRLKRAFADLALRDELTGSHNRRGILEYAQRRYAEARQSGGHFSIALVDLDHFKAINDSFGHDVGDAVLQAFAVAAQARLRESDWLGRFGGEEWLIVMPGTPASQAEAIFARLRAGVAALALPELPAGYPVAFSMGVAELSLSDGDFPALLKRADRALYAAKSGGRDRYVVAD